LIALGREAISDSAQKRCSPSKAAQIECVTTIRCSNIYIGFLTIDQIREQPKLWLAKVPALPKFAIVEVAEARRAFPKRE
jgi:hypothetical protein